MFVSIDNGLKNIVLVESPGYDLIHDYDDYC